MAEEEKKIIVDDDWKAEAKREKERLVEETAQPETLPDPTFAELINMVGVQAMIGFGGMAGPGGEQIPPNMAAAKHYIDMLQVLEEKTQGNLDEEEKKLLDQIIYELRMRFMQTAGGAGGPGTPGAQ